MRADRSRFRTGSLLALLLIGTTISTVDAKQNRQSRPSQRHLEPSGFPWPNGAEMALSLTFDDGRPSQVTHAIPLLDSFGVKATFYSQPKNLRNELASWRQAVAAGHEIGNHTVGHPCTGNFAWVRYDSVVLESYDLERMRAEILQANEEIEDMLGVRPVSFAYPCGQTYVGRGRDTRSYVPLVAEIFQTGRRWLDETSNAPNHFDTAQVMAMRMDGEDLEGVQRMIERTKLNGNWLVLAGHGVGNNPRWGTDLDMLEELLAYARDPTNRMWIAPVAEVATYISDIQTANK